MKDAKIIEKETELSLLAKKHLEQMEIKDAELSKNETEFKNQESNLKLTEIKNYLEIRNLKMDLRLTEMETSSKDSKINNLVNELNQKKEEIAKLQSDYTTLHRAFTRTYGYGH